MQEKISQSSIAGSLLVFGRSTIAESLNFGAKFAKHYNTLADDSFFIVDCR